MALSRPTPLMGAMSYKTYTIRPRFRRATCAEVDCAHYRDGWTFPLEELLKDQQLLYMAKHAGRQYEEKELGGKTYLVYAPGQPCFASRTHKVPIEEKPLLYVGRGDYRTFDGRGLPRDARQHDSVSNWVDDFANHQDKLRTVYERG